MNLKMMNVDRNNIDAAKKIAAQTFEAIAKESSNNKVDPGTALATIAVLLGSFCDVHKLPCGMALEAVHVLLHAGELTHDHMGEYPPAEPTSEKPDTSNLN